MSTETILSSETIIIMRHGFRADTAGEEWTHRLSRPWDPPLAHAGWKEAWMAGLNMAKFISKPDIVISSPYTRCLQTSSAILKAFKSSYDHLAIDKGLSESYDWYNAVRYVDSDDISLGGRYRNMGDWFFCCRQRNLGAADVLLYSKPVWRLVSCTSMPQILKAGVFDYWQDPVSKRKKIREFGKFPDFEMYVNLGINEGVNERRSRYVRALNRCINALGKSSPRKKHRVGVVVSHMAGVGTMYEHLLQATPAKIGTAGYFIVRRVNGGPFRLIADHLA